MRLRRHTQKYSIVRAQTISYTQSDKTPLRVTNASLTRGALRALRELAHAPRAQVAHRAVVCTCSVCCRMPTSTDTMHFQVRYTAAALNHAHAHWLACVCMKAQRTPSRSKMTIRARCVPIFERICRLYRNALLLTSHLHAARLCGGLTGMSVCVLHVWLRASSSSFRLCASTHSVDLRPVVVCVSERQGSAGPVVRVVTFRGVISHGVLHLPPRSGSAREAANRMPSPRVHHGK